MAHVHVVSGSWKQNISPCLFYTWATPLVELLHCRASFIYHRCGLLRHQLSFKLPSCFHCTKISAKYQCALLYTSQASFFYITWYVLYLALHILARVYYICVPLLSPLLHGSSPVRGVMQRICPCSWNIPVATPRRCS